MMKSIEELKTIIQNRLASRKGNNRFSHILGVLEVAIEIAINHDLDPYAASVAALVHDATKYDSMIEHTGRILRSFSATMLQEWPKPFWHCLSAVDYAKYDLGIEDLEILQAIQYHGPARQAMSHLEMLLYVADYAEPTRPFENQHIRVLAKKDLTKAMAQSLFEICEHEQKKGHPLMFITKEALLYYQPYLEETL